MAQGPDGGLVALKRLREELAADPEFRARFRREATALLRVQGTCAVRVLAVEADASCPFVVMEYVPGPTLAEHVGEHGPLRGDMAHGFAVGLAEALVAIHRCGLVHRDLKPGNVLLSEQGPKVIDFGIAQAADATALTRTGVTLGTVGYMAPEQVRGQAGPPADVFAWALTVAYATTGRPPFGTGRPEAVLYRIVHDAPDLDGVPAPLRPLLASALDRSPEGRPTPGQLLHELTGGGGQGAAADSGKVGTLLASSWRMPRPPDAPRAPLFGRRTTWVAAAAAVVLLATAAFLSTVLPGHGHSAASSTSGQPAPPATTTPTPSTTPPSTTRAGTPPPTIPRAASAASTPTAAPAPPPPAVSSPSAAAPGPIGNTGSGLCVDTNGPQRSGLEVVLRSCGNFTGQIWSYDRTSLHLTNTPSGMCLDTNGAPSAGVAAVINPCGYYSGQQWIYDATGGRFTNPVSGLCLDTNGPPALDAGLVLNPCGSHTGQYWRV